MSQPPPTATAGDRIVVRLGDGQCNIDKITAAGERVVDRTYISINMAWDVSHTGAAEDGGRVWICDQSALDLIRLWPSRRASDSEAR
jgi:hypothetical protein